MRAVGRTLRLVAGAVVVCAMGAGAPQAVAQSKTCPQISPSYTGPCGPTFALPGWGDAGGWKYPEQYETIQLADVDGDGDDELLARTPAGVAIHDFDKRFGQWRPQVTRAPTPWNPNDTRDFPVVLTAFANPPPLSTANPNPPATDWTLPQYYDTIQAADIDGDKRAEVLGRSANGVIVYDYTPGAGGAGGSWRQVTNSGPLPDSDHWNDGPYYYATIQTGDIDGDRDEELVARGSGGVVAYGWTGSGWRTIVGDGSNIFSDTDSKASFKSPAYWTSVQLSDLNGDGRQEVIGRESTGVVAYELPTGDRVDGVGPGPFADVLRLPDCPFDTAPRVCFDDGPAYYATIQLADVDGNGREELLGRASDGMRVRRYQGDSPDSWGHLPTLTDLSDANGYADQSRWETIQFADINGDKRAEALARGPQGLLAWSYDRPSRTWKPLPANPALALADDPWASDRSYYSTIQTGDVNGDGHADVVARGPYGIRTWFYNRRGTGGWERYLPEGYQDFETRACTGGATPPCGEAAAYDTLNGLVTGELPGGSSTIRGVWQGPSVKADDFANTIAPIVDKGGCTNKSQDNPPQYASCTPPAGSTRFTAAEWTSVANKLLAETFWAEQAWLHYYDPATGLKQVWFEMFEEQLGKLDDIAKDLKLDGPAEVQTEYTPAEAFSVTFGLMGAIFAAVPEASPLIVAFLWGLSEGTSMIPSASPDLLAAYDAKFSELKTKLHDGLAQANDRVTEHDQLVRRDQGLLNVVGQLSFRGPWELDPIAMSSASRQGFALWAYQEMAPTVWSRYVITGCTPIIKDGTCSGPPPGPWMQGSSVDFTAIGPSPTPTPPFGHATPCAVSVGDCVFTAPNPANAKLLWGQLDENCMYDGVNATKVWDAAKGCTLGIDPRTMLADPATVSASRRWSFHTYSGDPTVDPFHTSAAGLRGSVSGIGDTRDDPRASRTRTGAVVRLRASVAVPRRLRLGRARIELDRLIFERGGTRELARHRSGRALPPLVLVRRGASGTVFASRARRGPRVRLQLRRTGRGRSLLRLVARDVTIPREPVACNGTRPGVDFATEPITLHTRLRIHDGRRRPASIPLRAHWECRRDRLGALRRLVLRRPALRRPSGRRPGLAVRGPRRLAAGRRGTYRIVVRNRRRTTAYDVLISAALPRDLGVLRPRGTRLRGGRVAWRLRALGPGRSRTLRLRVRVARPATGRVCPTFVASAIDTRAAGKRVCIRVARRASSRK